MGQTTTVEWTNATWNPWRGCTKVSPGCKNCYMYREQTRYGKDPRIVTRTKPATFNAPLDWDEPAKVFTCSWSDWFIAEADEWREEAWSIIRQTPHLAYQILTKRPERIWECLPNDWENGYANVWLGVSVESPDYLYRISHLRGIPAVVRFISYEPALAFVDFTNEFSNGEIHWLISGGESGYNPRSANPDWFISVREQCARANVAYFHKQNGGSVKVNGSYGGNALMGEVYRQFPTYTVGGCNDA